MPEQSDRLEYWKKRMMEQEIVELKDEIAALKKTVEILEPEDSVEAEEEEE